MVTSPPERNPSVIVVGAGPGLGTAIATRFARAGMVPGLIARTAATLDLTAASVREATGVTPMVATADAGDPDGLARAWESLVDRIGDPVVAVYNALAVAPGPPTTLDLGAFAATLAVNVLAPLRVAQLAAPAMRREGAGTILLTGGGLSLEPVAALAALAAGKAAVRNLTGSLAQELGPDGIHVATVTVCGRVAPGTAWDPDVIASAYWELHTQPPEEWALERVFD